MRKLIPFLLAALLVAAIAVVNAQEEAVAVEKPWFDLENCGFCKNLLTDGLIEHLTWETFVVPTGMMEVTTVEPGWEDKYATCLATMEETGKKMMAGETVPMCGMCQSYGTMFMTNKVEWKNFDTKAGHISLMTSTDPEVIAMVHAHAERTIDEYAKMEAAEMEKMEE